MQFFYHPDAPASGIFSLDSEESRHCLRVLRKKAGDTIEVVDGKGALYETEIISDRNKICEVKVISCKSGYGHRDFRISIGIAPPKNIERFEWFLEKATEIGIDEIHPFFTERSERTRLNIPRLSKILVSAMKQSAKAYLPALHEAKKFEEMMVGGVASKAGKHIAVCDPLPHPLSKENPGIGANPHLKDTYEKGSDALILIGPEGDFTGGEVKLAMASGFRPVSLGSSRLRVETAGVVACQVVNMMNE